jgi:hypothetical protein
MPIESICRRCGRPIVFEGFAHMHGAIWAHLENINPYHEAIPPREIAEQFKRQRDEPE